MSGQYKKILEDLRAYGTPFYHQEKSLHDHEGRDGEHPVSNGEISGKRVRAGEIHRASHVQECL
jgi:hypothetical protein